MNKEEFIGKLQMVYVGDRNAFNEIVSVYENLQQRIDDAIERLNALIIFWKKYNPIDNTMQVEQFKGVIKILGGEE